MAFRATDFKKTMRKGQGDGPAALYPHQMRDKKTLSRLAIAIRLFDQMVGKRRGEMDAGALVDFFGDPRLARGVVACLGQYYQYRSLRFEEMVGLDGAERLQACGLALSREIRGHTYAFINTHCDGFVTEEAQPGCYGQIAQEFALSARDWDALMHADAEENQILTRPGSVPEASDIAALYNFHSLDTALRRAVGITLTGLPLSPSAAADVRKTAAHFGLHATLSGGDALTLKPCDPVSGVATRPGSFGRVLLSLLSIHATRVTAGHADVRLGTRRCRLVLGLETLRALGADTSGMVQPTPLYRRVEMGDILHREILKLRARGEAAGWRIKRHPEPLVTSSGVLLPDFRLTQGGRDAFLLLEEASGNARDVPLIFLPLGRRAPDAAETLTRTSAALLNLFTLSPITPPAVPTDVRALCDRAASQGLVRAADAQRTLHLLNEEPLIAWVRQAADPRVRYIPGVGLCAQELVSALQNQ